MATTDYSLVAGALLCLLCVLPALDSSPQCDHYGGCRNYPFLPAPPGHVPSCAKPGQTYCEKIEHYPTQLIRYLIEQWGYDYNTLLSDESRDGFNYSRKPEAELRGVGRTPVPYGPHHHYPHRGYTYGPPKLALGVPLSYYPLQLVAPPAPVPPPPVPAAAAPAAPPPPASGPAPNASAPVAATGGYPDRRYKLPPHQQHFLSAPFTPLYTTLLQPAAVSHYNPDEWWTRYARSNKNSEGNDGVNLQSSPRSVRHRRQANNAGSNPLCPTSRRFIMPKAAMNNQGNWMFVVNLNEVDDRYTQLVGTETCSSNRCNGLCSIPNGYTSRCEQQYVQKRLVALEPTGNQLYTDVFWFPHCCVCQITQTG